jgi:hypothetical protein
VLRLEPGVMTANDHLHASGPGVGLPPPGYLGLTLERSLSRLVSVDVTLGASLLLGPVYGATVRLVPIAAGRFRISAGAGPMLVQLDGVGLAAFGQLDVSGEARFGGTFVAVVDGGAAYALNQGGAIHCGTDSCGPYLSRGDRVLSVRAGVGYAF